MSIPDFPPIPFHGIDWSRMPEGTVESRFAAPSGSLAVASWGDPGATRVVCVPGITGSKEDFLLLGPTLAGLGYFVQAFDIAGQYESAQAGPSPGAAYDYRLFIDDLRAFLDAGAPAHVVGYSFGGIVAMQLIAEREAGVRSLALVSVPPLAGQCFRAFRGVGPVIRFASPRTAAAVMLTGLRWNVNRTDRTRAAFVRRRLLSTSRPSVVDALGLMMRIPDVEAAIAGQRMPKLVAVGKKDLWPIGLHRDFARRIGARFSLYPSGHRPPEQSPNELVRDLLRLFREAGD